MTSKRPRSAEANFNGKARLPYGLRTEDFRSAMQDVYDFLFDVNRFLAKKGLQRLDDMLRPAAMSGVLSDTLTASLARHSRTLVENTWHNGHPDLVLQGRYAGNAAESGKFGVEVKSTRKKGGGVDTHGARKQWMCVFVYEVDDETEPTSSRRPTRFTELYLAQVDLPDFRSNARRSEIGTRTATLHKEGLAKLRSNWIYLDQEPSTRKAAKRGSALHASSK